MLAEIEKALLRQKQCLTVRQKVSFVFIAFTLLLLGVCVLGVALASHHYWLLIPAVPLELLAILGINLFRAVFTSLDSTALPEQSSGRPDVQE